MRALVLLVLLAGTAVAQPPPTWSPDRGWDQFDREADAMQREFAEGVRKSREDFEATRARNEREFNNTAKWMFGGFAVVAFFMILGALVHSRRRQLLALEYSPPVEYVPVMRAASGTVDVTALRIGIDGRASKFVKTELEAIAKTYGDNTPETRARKLREVSVMLRRVRDSWVYGGADNEPMRPREEAFSAFARHVDEARTRVTAKSTPTAPPHGPPVALILVSVIVAARGELMTVTELATGEDLRRALESAAHRAADEILALEVVWAADVSSVDLESVYRRAELHPLDGASVGKVFCTYCSGPFPGELVSCPHCGGPAPGRERRTG